MDCHCSCCSVVDQSSLACGIALVLRDNASIDGLKRRRMAMELTSVRERRNLIFKKEKTIALIARIVAVAATHSMDAERSCHPKKKKKMVAKRRTETDRPRLRARRWGLRAAKAMADADGITHNRIAASKSNWCAASIVARGSRPIAVKAATRGRSGQDIRPMRRMKSSRVVPENVTSTRTQRAANLRWVSIDANYMKPCGLPVARLE